MPTIARFLVAVAVLTVAGLAASAHAQQFPTKPIRIIYPYTIGGGSSTLYLALAEFMSQDLGQRVLIESKAGGNGIVGIDFVAKAPADGYTLLTSFDGDLIKQHLTRNLPYDTKKDLMAVTGIAETAYVLAFGPSMPAKTIREMAAIARSKPGQVSFGSFGEGSFHHLWTEVFSKQLGIKLKQIPYRSTNVAFTDVNGGTVDMMFGSVSAVLQHVQSGSSRAIVTLAKSRDSRFPNVPTFAEEGLTGLDQPSWIGLHGPAGIPKPIVDRIHSSVMRAFDNADFRTKQLEPLGWLPLKADSTALAALQEADDRKWGAVIREVGITLQ